jgi:thymidylate kinase
MILISVEGLDSSGKTTVAETIVTYLRKTHLEHLYLHEGELRRDAKSPFLSPFFSLKDPWVRDLLYSALTISTVQNCLSKVAPDTVVVIDRYVDSLWAYTDENSNYTLSEYVREFVHAISFDAPIPNLTLFCNTPLTEVERRRTALGESFNLEFEQRTLKQFKERLGRAQTRVVEVHPETPPVDIVNEVRNRLRRF